MNNCYIKNKLKTIPQFETLTSDDIDDIYNISKTVFFKEKTFVFHQNEQLTKIFFILSGRVKIFHEDKNGKELIINFLNEGDMFPHFGFFKERNYPANAIIVEDAQLLYISRENLEALLLSKQQLLVKFLIILGDKIVELQNRLEEQIFLNNNEKIIRLFNRLCDTNAIKVNDYYQLNNCYTMKELANMIGVSNEAFNKVFKKLKNERIITINEDGVFCIYKSRMLSKYN